MSTKSSNIGLNSQEIEPNSIDNSIGAIQKLMEKNPFHLKLNPLWPIIKELFHIVKALKLQNCSPPKQSLPLSTDSTDSLDSVLSPSPALPEIIEHSRSIIVVGLKETPAKSATERFSADQGTIMEIMKLLDVECRPTSVYRIGSPSKSKTRLVKVILPSAFHRSQLLSMVKKLKKVPKFNNVFIRPSLTAAQRKKEFELRLECRNLNSIGLRTQIYHGKILPHSWNSNVFNTYNDTSSTNSSNHDESNNNNNNGTHGSFNNSQQPPRSPATRTYKHYDDTPLNNSEKYPFLPPDSFRKGRQPPTKRQSTNGNNSNGDTANDIPITSKEQPKVLATTSGQLHNNSAYTPQQLSTKNRPPISSINHSHQQLFQLSNSQEPSTSNHDFFAHYYGQKYLNNADKYWEALERGSPTSLQSPSTTDYDEP